MTDNERWLLRAEADLRAYLERRTQIDFLPKGQYEQLGLARAVAAAKHAVQADAERAEREQREQNDALYLAAVLRWFRENAPCR